MQLGRQRPADWVVTGLGHSASTSQALGESEGLSLGGADGGQGRPCCSFLARWCVCWGFVLGGVWAVGSGIGPGGGEGQAYTSHPFASRLPAGLLPKRVVLLSLHLLVYLWQVSLIGKVRY